MDPQTIIQNSGEALTITIPRTDSALPLSIEAAETIWRDLASAAQRDVASLGPLQGAWYIGQHGGEPVAIILQPDGQIDCHYFHPHPVLLRALPRFTYAAGSHSLLETIRSKSPAGTGHSLVWHQSADELAAVLHDFFIHHSTKPIPEDKPIEIYDASKSNLRTSSAESIMAAAFQGALKAARPSDEKAFRDCWARAALAYVVDDCSDLRVLTEAGAKALDILRVCNVHRTRNDLIKLSRMLDVFVEIHEERLQAAIELQLPYANAQRAYLAAFRRARALSLSGTTGQRKPFSQRLIKGLLLAKVAEARLIIGSLFQAVSPALVARYGKAWPHMQAIEVVAIGRKGSELNFRQDVPDPGGTFSLLDEQGVVLDPPRVLLNAPTAIIDPSTMFHEWEHVRQHMAAEGPMDDFEPHDLHAAEPTEWKAKQAEADFVSEFGILY